MPIFAKGEKVRLLKAVQNCPANSEGVVVHVDSQGNLTVTIEYRPTVENSCEPCSIILPFCPPSYFDKNTSCSKKGFDKKFLEELASLCKEYVKLVEKIMESEPESAERKELIERLEKIVVKFKNLK